MEDVVIMQRAYSLANEDMHTIALQYRRLQTAEPEDNVFVMRRWADLQIFIIFLYRFQTAVKIAQKIPAISSEIQSAITEFNKSVPGLKKLRDVGEHINYYAVDDPKRHEPSVDRTQLQSELWDGKVYEWLDVKLNVDDAKIAAEKLFASLKYAKDKILKIEKQKKNDK